ncbi:MAG: class I SAM-dependent methyltransferase [Bryobacteraceae bacterium]|nr:class I SAM-dependent methyltransferase [Bryobacteraceae bacterium]
MRWFSRLLGLKPASPELSADLRRRIRASFEASAADEEHFPSTIDPRILHVRVVLEHLGADLHGRRVLDAGCGKARFARVLLDERPGVTVVGMDLAESMLRFVPPGVQPLCGSLTELPFADAAFDGAYATESLEHAVEIEKAVAELCRVVKPGGRIAVIDKNAGQWGRLETPEWERWFTREEMERMLRRHCRRVESREISYWEDVPPDGLFLAWLAEK